MAAASPFRDLVVYIHEPGLGKTRTKILKNQVVSKGGRVCEGFDDSVSHVLVGGKVTREKLLKTLFLERFPDQTSVLNADWLSNCLTHGELVALQPYVVPVSTPKNSPQKKSLTSSKSIAVASTIMGQQQEKGEDETIDETECLPSGKREPPLSSTEPKKMKTNTSPMKMKSKNPWDCLDSDSDYVDSAEEEERDIWEDDAGIGADNCDNEELLSSATHDVSFKQKGLFVCQMPSTLQAENKNKNITDKLEELLKSYENNGDQWRVYTYTKVIQVLKKHPKPVTSWEEAKSLPFVGDRLADKIWEIVQSGHLRRLDHINEQEKLVDVFKKIWGVGATSARRFVQLGYKTLEEVGKSGILTRVQQVGLRHYNDFNERIPRSEVKEIEEKVCELAHSINSGLECITCGSYRRGKETCGDVDMLITHPDGRSHKGVFQEILKRGHDTEFLTDDLVIQENNESQSKYLGVCKLPGEGRKYRRLDIIVVPYCELPCALLYFTGSAHFNRSMRLKAHKQGMSLSEHALLEGVIRKGNVITHKGSPVPVFSEKDVFKRLGLNYCEPHERNWN